MLGGAGTGEMLGGAGTGAILGDAGTGGRIGAGTGGRIGVGGTTDDTTMVSVCEKPPSSVSAVSDVDPIATGVIVTDGPFDADTVAMFSFITSQNTVLSSAFEGSTVAVTVTGSPSGDNVTVPEGEIVNPVTATGSWTEMVVVAT